MKLKFSWNVAVQAVATLLQLFNGYGSILPPKYQALGAGVLGGLQLIVGALAHYNNPDGTPAAEPYTPKPSFGPGPGVRVLVPLLLGLTFLSACISPFGPFGMSAAQLKEMARIKDAGATCVKGVYAGAVVTVTTFDVDKGIPAGLTIGENCQMSFTAPPK